jgi:hypothetical protein
MKYPALVIFLIFCKTTFTDGQEQKPSNFTLSVSSGLIKNATSDRLLNYFVYTGYTLQTIKLEASYTNHNNIFSCQIIYSKSHLIVSELNHSLYEYNDINNWEGEFNLEYYRNIWHVNSHIQIFIGVSNNAYFNVLKENFKNILYDYATSFRKSYDVSILNLSPNVLIRYHCNKHQFLIKSAYTFLNIASRPDDDYVKQVGQDNIMKWRFYSFRDYINFQFTTSYQYQVFNKMSLTLEYKLGYRTYTTPSEFKYLQKCLFVGITKSL